jgi:hypothetical protein
MAILFLVVGVVGLLGLSIMNIQLKDFELAAVYGIPGLALIIFTAIYFFRIKPMEEKRARDKLLEWISENKSEILGGRALYEGEKITKDTVLIRYCIVYSAIIYTKKEFSNYCLQGSERSYRIGIISTIFNLVMGWWGFPWGLIYTPQSLYINLSKSESISVDEVIASPPLRQSTLSC